DSLRSEHEKARTEISRLAYSRKQEIDPDSYAMFLENLGRLTETERTVFVCYLEGKGTKEIMAQMGIKENTLKYHNKNIYSKLGVTSRKELLRFAAVMKQEQGEDVQDSPSASAQKGSRGQ
ncbi:MAG: helix-turn-helix transcriptional regulator, partial [Clostridia bacterium]|nr:helix-turn-helix transcriptional regulator [Clostridia bacterium]